VSENSFDTRDQLETLRIVERKPFQRRKGSLVSIFARSLLIIAVVAAIAFAAYTRFVDRTLAVQTIVVKVDGTNRPASLLTGSGYIVTRHKYITVGTKVLGQIIEEPIEEGQLVKAGAILARIDARDYEAQLREALAIRSLARAMVQLNLSKAERARQLIANDAISRDEFETATNAAEVARAQLMRDEAAVDYAQFNVNQCIIVAPIDGIVLKKFREVGDTINFGGLIQPGGGATDIAQLADTKEMRAEVDVNEAEISKVSVGARATVVLDSYPDREFSAAVVKMYPEADRQKGTIKIEVQLANPDRNIVKPEMSAKVTFLLSQVPKAEKSLPILPSGAVKTDGSQNFVWVIRSDVARKTPVTVGRTIKRDVEIRAGVNDGDIVIVSDVPPVQEGQKVKEAKEK
jgi:RND family efflux transporter MFP subunit